MGAKLSENNRLDVKNPQLVSEWHPTKNDGLTPDKITYGSHQKVWWICTKGHEWKAIIKSRNNGNGCPICSGYQVHHDNCLSTINPKLAAEWHPTKNETLTPEQVTKTSGRKVSWICSKGHEWEAKISNRSNGNGCPVCVGRKIHYDNCLSTINPRLASEWHPTKNGSLTSNNVTCYSCYKIWWICSKGHEWKAKISDRSKGSGCPICAGHVVHHDNCLLTINPLLAKEWHTTKNSCLTPEQVTHGSNRKIWWICQKKHEWEATIKSRNNGNGCPICNSSKGEKLVAKILSELKIPFKPQARFYGCKGIFDFAVYKNNNISLIEYQGKQHYEPTGFGNHNPQKCFSDIIRRDQNKRDWCKLRKIPLLEIPYWEKNNADKLIIDFLHS